MLSRQTQSSLVWALYRLVSPLIFAQGAFALVSALLSFSGPFFLNRIIKFVEDPNSLPNPNWAFGLVIGLFICSMSRACADGQTYFLGRRIGTRVRAALIGELYAKSLKRANHATSVREDHGDGSNSAHSGEIINLMSVGMLSYHSSRKTRPRY